eukprot:m.59055 g.59055  ORF g.59055 m.59055 type:complete len:359 (-) comp11220_c0_seq1:23-1099(-)
MTSKYVLAIVFAAINVQTTGSVSEDVKSWRDSHWPSLKCPQEKQTSTVFFKTHKTGSTSFANLMYRLAIHHNLSVYKPDCQWLQNCLPNFDTAQNSEKFLVAANHYAKVINENGTGISNETFREKSKRYNEAALFPPVQMITVLRNPVDAFISKYEYFHLKQKLGTIKHVLQLETQMNGQTRDLGIFSDLEYDHFMQHDFQSIFFHIMEKFSLSLALWKLACGLDYEDVVMVKSNKHGSHKQTSSQKLNKKRIINEAHARDWKLYNAAIAKLQEAEQSYPNQSELRETVGYIELMNDNMNEECSKSHAPMCLMLYLKPLRFAAILKNNSVETILRTNETVLEILAKLSVIANSAQTQH